MLNPTHLQGGAKIRVLLVGDHEVFLRAATAFLELHHELVIVGTAGGGEEALLKARELEPQVVLIDVEMRGPSGLETIPRLRALLPAVGIVAMSLMDGGSYADIYRRAALAAGADDLVSKANLATELLPAIRRVMQVDRHVEGPMGRSAPSPVDRGE